MTTISSTARNIDGASAKTAAAAAVWFLSVYLTWQAWLRAGLPSDISTEAGQWVVISAIITQVILSFIEMRTWRGGATWEAWMALAIDVAINYAGIAPFAVPVAAYLAQDLPTWGILNFAWIASNLAPLAIAYMIAWVPESLWREGTGNNRGGRP